MNLRFLCLWIALSLCICADVPVDFSNVRLSPIPLALYDGAWEHPLDPTSAHWNAQLLMETSFTNPAWVAVGPPVWIRTNAPGTFDGGIRILPGVTNGQHVDLQVVIWDTKYAKTWSVAMSGDGLGDIENTGLSDAFDYVYQGDSRMVNFSGMSIITVSVGGFASCVFHPPPPTAEVFCQENDSIILLPTTLNCGGAGCGGDFGLGLIDRRTPNSPLGFNLGGTSFPDGINHLQMGIRYTPRLNTYGDDWCYQYLGGGNCDPPKSSATQLRIHVLPSPRRPYLVATPAAGKTEVKLRGLAQHQYTIEHSEDLLHWQSIRTVAGNTTEIDLTSDLILTTSTYFLRALETGR